MLVYNDLSILLKHAQHFSTFCKVTGPWVDFDVHRTADAKPS